VDLFGGSSSREGIRLPGVCQWAFFKDPDRQRAADAPPANAHYRERRQPCSRLRRRGLHQTCPPGTRAKEGRFDWGHEVLALPQYLEATPRELGGRGQGGDGPRSGMPGGGIESRPGRRRGFRQSRPGASRGGRRRPGARKPKAFETGLGLRHRHRGVVCKTMAVVPRPRRITPSSCTGGTATHDAEPRATRARPTRGLARLIPDTGTEEALALQPTCAAFRPGTRYEAPGAATSSPACLRWYALDVAPKAVVTERAIEINARAARPRSPFVFFRAADTSRQEAARAAGRLAGRRTS